MVLTISPVMAMPIKLIYNLQISLKQKAGLVCVFSLCFVMIIFAIIRARQVLIDQYFVNLVLLEIWSTLAASICEYSRTFILFRDSTIKLAKPSPELITILRSAVIVGCLPAFKSLIANRATTRSNLGSSSNRSKTKPNDSNKRRKTSIPLDSFSSDKKRPTGWHASGTDSQEEMVKAEDAHAITVKNDVVSASC
jgi:Fungal rhodopsin domain